MAMGRPFEVRTTSFSLKLYFTPVIGFGKGRIEDLAPKISKNLRNINYCPFKPENQEFDSEKLKIIYNDLKIDKLLEESIKNGLEIKIF